MSLSGLTGTAKEDLVSALAILILHDAGAEVSADNINALAKASNNTLAGYWGALYAKVLTGRNVEDLLLKPGMGGAAPAAGGAAAPAAGGAAEKEEKKKEEEEEEEAGGAGGLFGGDDDDW